jgi:hypothetical protein
MFPKPATLALSNAKTAADTDLDAISLLYYGVCQTNQPDDGTLTRFGRSADNDGLYRLYGMASGDGLTWAATDNGWLHPGSNIGPFSTRDAAHLEHNGKVYRICNHHYSPGTAGAATDGGPDAHYDVWSTEDFETWTHVSYIPAPEGSAHETFGMDVFKDGDGTVYALLPGRASTEDYYRIWIVAATNAALTEWGTPVEVIGTGIPTTIPEELVNPPFPGGCIDPSIWKSPDGTYLLFYINEAYTHVEVAKAATLAGPWTRLNASSTDNMFGFEGMGVDHWIATSFSNGFEGCCAVPLGGNKVRLYCDRWVSGSTYVTDGVWNPDTQTFASWTPPTLIDAPRIANGFQAAKITDNDLIRALLQCVNHPSGTYPGHAELVIDPATGFDLQVLTYRQPITLRIGGYGNQGEIQRIGLMHVCAQSGDTLDVVLSMPANSATVYFFDGPWYGDTQMHTVNTNETTAQVATLQFRYDGFNWKVRSESIA